VIQVPPNARDSSLLWSTGGGQIRPVHPTHSWAPGFISVVLRTEAPSCQYPHGTLAARAMAGRRENLFQSLGTVLPLIAIQTLVSDGPIKADSRAY